VKDHKRNVNHTVTLVRFDNQTMLLDNELDSVVPADSVSHYKPVFAANENAWWLFK
jgi:predicted transglutaminase-like cysteine proteinase